MALSKYKHLDQNPQGRLFFDRTFCALIYNRDKQNRPSVFRKLHCDVLSSSSTKNYVRTGADATYIRPMISVPTYIHKQFRVKGT